MELDSIIQDMLYQQRNPKQGKKRLFQPEELENPHARWRINKESMGKYFKLSNIGINLHIPEYNKIQVAHKHSFFELIYVYRGRMKNQVDRTKIDLEQGDFCLMNPDAIHTPVTIGENALALNILMTNDLFEKSFMNLILDNQLLANFFVDSLFQKKTGEKLFGVFSTIFKSNDNTRISKTDFNRIFSYCSISTKRSGIFIILFICKIDPRL